MLSCTRLVDHGGATLLLGSRISFLLRCTRSFANVKRVQSEFVKNFRVTELERKGSVKPRKMSVKVKEKISQGIVESRGEFGQGIVN